MDTQSVAPVVLVILDGWGYRDVLDGNAVLSAHTPVMDSLWATYPHTLLEASGRAVGLPAGQMGNSEVGHLTLGAGRVVPQELVRISDAVETGYLLQEPLLVDLCRTLKERGGRLHLLGLCSKGGVHSHIDHLYGLLKLAAQAQVPTYIHAITDGRDTLPCEGVTILAALQKELDLLGNGVIATLSGRYYAMDRDRRWDRTQKAYEVMTKDGPSQGRSVAEVMEEFYSQDLTDEFIPPTRLAPGAIQDGDAVIFFNFRPDRARQLTQAFVSPDFSGFERPLLPNLTFVTMTQYEADLPVQVLFKPQNLEHLLGQVVSEANLKQLRIAETEKYAHVTYFFNGGIEQPFPGEDRILVQSPMVTTYDQAPEMSALEVTEKVIEAVARREYSLVVLNYANPDMVGHTGNYEATVRAIETLDQCLGKLLAAVVDVGGTTLILADHGNAEMMWDENHNPWTAHTTSPVPCILVEGEGRKIPGRGGHVKLRSGGSLADVAPTLLEILGLPQPEEMTGRSLLEPAEYSLQRHPIPAVR
ncbi:MAG: 2,3-bisphosphoglycerate-independent phosphoglycerate mutase [Cyanobacteriota bacterium]